MSEKKLVNIEFDAEFYNWLSGFSSEVGLPMDKLLMMAAHAGIKHLSSCEKIPMTPVTYRHRLLQEEGAEQ